MEILGRTPPWVFVLFFVLLGLGRHQSRPRTVSLFGAMALPVAMISLSAYGVLSAFPGSLLGIAAWLGAVAAAVCLNCFLGYPRGVVFEPATRSLAIPGSWIPLTLMMIIYFTKYGVGVALARNPGLPAVQWFVGAVSLAYGLISGLFFARAISLWRIATRSAADVA